MREAGLGQRQRQTSGGSWVAPLALGMLLMLLFGLYLAAGSIWIDPVSALLGQDGASNQVLVELRLKRGVMAVGVGASLALSGTAFQALLRNSLADPFIVGVSGGAAVGGTLAMLPVASMLLAGVGVAHSVVVFGGSFLGALAATFLLFGMSWVRGMVATNHLLLMGVVFNFFASAVVMFLKSLLVGNRLQEVLFWLMGTLASEAVPWPLVWTVLGVALAGAWLLCVEGKRVDALAVGEEFAHGSGVDPERLKRKLFLVSAVLVAGAVALSGFVGFVGLVVPHMLRLTVGASHRHLFPLSAVGGALFLLAADLIARLISPWMGTQLPVGVLTSLVGGPLFIAMLVRAQRKEVVL